MDNLDPAALDCLAALADHGGFEAAAQRLAITQSAVSQRLRDRQPLCGGLEAAMVGQRGQAIECGGVQVVHKNF